MELLFVLIAMTAVILLVVVGIPKAKVKAQQARCFSGLRSAAFCFKMFAGDNDNRFPFAVTNALAYQDTSNAWLHFQTMSNELGSARILMCPADAARKANEAISFDSTPTGLGSLKNSAVSYFVNVDANETNASMVLIGDRNLAIAGQGPTPKSITLSGTDLLQWNGELHRFKGNAALVDGSVQLQVQSLSPWTNHTNPVRLAIP